MSISGALRPLRENPGADVMSCPREVEGGRERLKGRVLSIGLQGGKVCRGEMGVRKYEEIRMVVRVDVRRYWIRVRGTWEKGKERWKGEKLL